MPSTYLAAIVAFSVMILVHEFGHFLVAKRVGITVHAFAIGFGPRLWGFRAGETEYAINLLPFGGYVRMAGEDLDEARDPGSFRAKSVWERLAVVAAGPVMNLMLAILILIGIALTLGVPVGVSNRIGQLMPRWPAEQAGLRPGDAIVAINGVPMASGDAVVETIHRSPNQVLRLTIDRAGARLEVSVRSRLDPQQNIGLIGFRPEVIRDRMGPGRATVWALQTLGETVDVIFTTLVGLLREGRKIFDQLAGPVGAVRLLSEAGAAGAEIFLYTAGALSIMIGVFNLLPLPALDGGRLLFLLLEAVRRRPLDPRREGYVHLVGFALLILLLLTLTVRDIGNL